MKKWFKYFVYISLVFLIIALIKADYLVAPTIENHFLIGFSIFLVFLWFVFDSVSWKMSLKSYGYRNISTKNAIASMGLSIFGKYIPGKIWLILGRSAYISNTNKIPKKDSAAISLNAQFISLWTGLLLGALVFLLYKPKAYLALITLSLWLTLTLILFTRVVHKFIIAILYRLLKKQVSIPSLNINNVFKVLPWFFATWFFWCIGFYTLAQGLSAVNISFVSGLIFALAGTLGLLAIFIPGGLGVREGIVAGLLIMSGLDEALAITISVASRLWFLIGESFIFFIGLYFNIKSKQN